MVILLLDQFSQKVLTKFEILDAKFSFQGSDHDDGLDEITDDEDIKPTGVKRKLDDTFENETPPKRARTHSKYVNLLERLFPDQKSDVNLELFESETSI